MKAIIIIIISLGFANGDFRIVSQSSPSMLVKEGEEAAFYCKAK